MKDFKSPSQTIFYSLEKTIKLYRRFAQTEINAKYKDITLDQALILISIDLNPELSLSEISKIFFKDNASITRIIECLVMAKYLQRSIDQKDKRTFDLKITLKGKESLKGLKTIIASNRKKALKGLTAKDLKLLEDILCKVKSNFTNMRHLKNAR